jgi:hypothetical protein
MKRLFFGAVLFAMPSMVFAAGFAKQSIFLSTNAPVEGQTVLIHASVSNPTSAKFTGKLKVRDASVDIGSVPVTLDAGAADDVSISWKPTAGMHTIVATLEDAGGSTVEEGTQIFSIAEKPSADGKPKSDVQPSTRIQQSLGNISPTTEKYAAPVFKIVDSGRVFAANELNKGINWSKQQLGVAPKTNSAFGTPQPKTSNTFWNILATAVLYILSVLLWLVGNAGVFYPILAVVFFYILWKCFKRFRRR